MGVISRLNRFRNPPASRRGAQGRRQSVNESIGLINADRADPAAVTRSEYDMSFPDSGAYIVYHSTRTNMPIIVVELITTYMCLTLSNNKSQPAVRKVLSFFRHRLT